MVLKRQDFAQPLLRAQWVNGGGEELANERPQPLLFPAGGGHSTTPAFQDPSFHPPNCKERRGTATGEAQFGKAQQAGGRWRTALKTVPPLHGKRAAAPGQGRQGRGGNGGGPPALSRKSKPLSCSPFGCSDAAGQFPHCPLPWGITGAGQPSSGRAL